MTSSARPAPNPDRRPPHTERLETLMQRVTVELTHPGRLAARRRAARTPAPGLDPSQLHAVRRQATDAAAART